MSDRTSDLRADLLADLAGPERLPGLDVSTLPPPPADPPSPALLLAVTPLRWRRPRRTVAGLQVGPVTVGVSRR